MKPRLNLTLLAKYISDFAPAAKELHITHDGTLWTAFCLVGGLTRVVQFTQAGVYGDSATRDGEVRSELHLASDIARELRR